MPFIDLLRTNNGPRLRQINKNKHNNSRVTETATDGMWLSWPGFRFYSVFRIFAPVQFSSVSAGAWGSGGLGLGWF